jgi:hypothetical protein
MSGFKAGVCALTIIGERSGVIGHCIGCFGNIIERRTAGGATVRGVENGPRLLGGREAAVGVVHFSPAASTSPSSSEPEMRTAAARRNRMLRCASFNIKQKRGDVDCWC